MLLSVIYLARVRQIVSQTRILIETRIAERERIARDLHDTLLQGVQGLILRFHDAMQEVPPNTKTRDSLESALEVADEVILEARNRVKRLRSEALENADLPQSLRKVGIELNHKNGLQFRIVVKGTVAAIQPSIGEELFFIGREGITNAFLHARPSEVEVEIDYRRTAFRLSCRDNGFRIDSAILHDKTRDGHLGILGMRERSKKIGGTFDIRSQHGEGTEIEVIVPARQSYLRRSGTLRSIINQILPRQD